MPVLTEQEKLYIAEMSVRIANMKPEARRMFDALVSFYEAVENKEGKENGVQEQGLHG